MNEIATVSPFEALGTNLRFGITEDGTPFVIGADFARAMDYRDARDAARLLDEDEKGTQIVRTPGGDQRMTVFYEDGIWELIFRSGKPEAKAMKKIVKSILASLRRGEVAVPAPRELSRLELIDIARAAEVGRLEEKAAREVAEQERDQLVPAASAWHGLVDRTGDISVGEAAKALRRAGADTGPNRLFRTLDQLGWIWKDARGDWRVKQSAIETGRLSERLTGTYEHPDTGQRVAAPPQVRVTFKGLDALHAHFVGARILPVRRQLSSAGGAA